MNNLTVPSITSVDTIKQITPFTPEEKIQILEYREGLDFSNALLAMRQRLMVRRETWPKKAAILIQTPMPELKMAASFICIRTADGDIMPWNPSHIDLLASDWEIVK